jgi:hypothetical protein
LYLARVRVDRIEDPAAYEFWTGHDGGHSFASSREQAAVVLREVWPGDWLDVGGSEDEACTQHGTTFVMATSSDFFHPREIRLRVANHPCGPWSDPACIAVPEVPGKRTDLVYCAYLHPELSPVTRAMARGEEADVVVTFCRMLAGEWELSNPESVRLRVRLRCHGSRPS